MGTRQGDGSAVTSSLPQMI